MPVDPKRPVRLGVVTKAHGVRGEVSVRLDEPGSTTLCALEQVEMRRPGVAAQLVSLEGVRITGPTALVFFEGVADRDQAQRLAGAELFTERGMLAEPEPGEYYAADLIGLAALAPDGERLGEVVGVLDTGAAPVLEVRGRGQWQVPLVDLFVKRIDLDAGAVTLELPQEDEEEA